MEKRGQVTLFILIGLVMLISLLLFIFYSRTIRGNIEPTITELNPVAEFVDSCVSQVAEEGIRTLGLNGGYIYFSDYIDLNPDSYLGFGPIGDLKNPYWWYNGITRIPTEDFMKEQLSRYIKEQLPLCTRDFDAFEADYNIQQVDDMEVKVDLGKDDVIIQIDYPLEILTRINNTIQSINLFRTSVPVRLKKVYETAKLIMEKENSETFLENVAIDLLNLDSHIPDTGIELGCEPKRWQLDDIKQRYRHLLRTNLPYIKIENTASADERYVPNPFDEQRYENSYAKYHYRWKLSEEPLEGISVTFSFDDKYPFYMYARPSKNGVLESNSQRGQQQLSFFCLHIWHFTYDAVFPVMASLVDKETLSHEKFLFRFPFEVSINHNQADRTNFGKSQVDTSDRPSNQEFCSSEEKKITLLTQDIKDGTPIDEVNITFTCGGYDCDIGQSEFISNGAAAGMIKKLPYCTSAIVRAKAAGYLDYEGFIDSEIDGSEFTLNMQPVLEFENIKILKHYDDSLTTSYDLSIGEKASVIIAQPEKNFESFTVYPLEGDYFPLQILAKEENTYNVDILVLDADDNVLGGYKGNWTVNQDDYGNTAIFHAVLSGSAVTPEQKALFMAGIEKYGEVDYLKPEIR